MLLRNRYFFSDNGTLSDLSTNLCNYRSQTETVAMVAAEDYIYIGSEYPFSYRYFDVSTANSNASVVSVDIWDGSEWTAAVDVVDETASSGVAFAQSGNIRWQLSENGTWPRDDTEDITGLTTLRILDFYWARLKVSADLSAGTALKYVGFKFSKDEDLGTFYPVLDGSGPKTAFESGKTDWNEQHFAAAEVIIRDLKQKDVIWTPDQLLDIGIFNDAAIHKVAEIVYRGMGGYVEERDDARKAYQAAMNVGNFRVDRDRDARLDPAERNPTRRIIRR